MKIKQPRVSRVIPVVAASVLFLLSSASPAEEGHNQSLCSNATLKGTFGFYRTGTVDEGTGGLAALGILTFDGKGNAAVLQSISRNGDYSYDVDGTFTYELDSDCTGKGFLEGTEFVRLVVTDDGHGIYMLSESVGNAVHGVGTKINN
jgi:hypothetical protein